MARSTQSNISILIISIFFLIGLFKLFHLQIFNGEKYKNISKNNFLREATVPSARGIIYDRNGTKISYSKPIVSLYIKSNSIENLKILLENLKNTIVISENRIKNILQSNSKVSVSKRILVKKDLSINEIFEIETNFSNNQNLELMNDYLRVYPYKEVGSHFIGHLTSDDKKDKIYGSLFWNRKGAIGIESDKNSELSGVEGSKFFFVNSLGNEVNVIDEKLTPTYPQKGQDVHTTIDIELQKLIYESMESFNGGVLVTSIETGEVLAIVSKPGFDPNLFSKPISTNQWKKLKNSKDNLFLNRVFYVTNPPGSIIKIITGLAGLEEKKVTKDTKFYCPGYTKVGNKRFRCWLKGGHGNVNLSKALTTSCDVYFYKLGLLLGIDKYSNWLDKFGVGKNISGLPYIQKKGTIPNRRFIEKSLNGNFYNGDMANVSIGQGYITLNVLQAHKIISLIANKGKFTGFNIYKDVKNNEIDEIKFNQDNLIIIEQGLVGAINDRGGTGFFARDDGKLAGKTGTAQIISKESRLYGKGKFKNHGWFSAYYPYNNPKIAITVFAENGESGGKAGGPIIKKIVSFYKQQYIQDNANKF